ncbi:DNA-binding response regulator [Rodentibacter sp. Ppn85]|nr:DNA-binding response regulator [Rodentibacter sp. Ppn85]
MRILLVEDDQMIAEAVSDGLKNACYAVDWVNNGNMAERALAVQPYDLVLLDLGLPERDGLQVLRHLRHLRQSQNHTPVLIVTARDDLESRLAGLDGGADDYIIKPFELAELLARIRAVLRRQGGQSTPLLTNASLTLNPVNYQVSVADQSEPIILSNKEFAILQALMNRPGIIHSRTELEDKIYAWGDEVESNAIDFLIHSLRKKIGKEHIKNVRGVGWVVAKN